MLLAQCTRFVNCLQLIFFLHQVFAPTDDVYCNTTEMAHPIAKRLQQSTGVSNEDDAKIAAIKIETRNESPTLPEAPRTGK